MTELDVEAQEVTAGVYDVTPEIAESLLALNVHNRTVSEDLVFMYARLMTAGDWHLNGETIKITRVGELDDGQHRLMAVVRSGKTVQMMIVTGLEKGTQQTVDRGRKRSLGDDLRMEGLLEYKAMAALARRIWTWRAGDPSGRGRMTRHVTEFELREIIDQNPRMRDSVVEAARLRRAIAIPPSVGGMAHFLFSGIDAAAAAFFFERLTEGDRLERDHPIAVLRRTVIDHTTLHRKRLKDHILLAYMIKAWNAYRTGRNIQVLRLGQSGKNPEAFPIPQ